MLLCLDQTQKDSNGQTIALEDLKLFGSNRISEAKLDFIYRPCSVRQRTAYNKNEKCLVNNIKDKIELK